MIKLFFNNNVFNKPFYNYYIIVLCLILTTVIYSQNTNSESSVINISTKRFLLKSKELSTKITQLGQVNTQIEYQKNTIDFKGKAIPINKQYTIHEKITLTHEDYNGVTKKIKPKSYKISGFRTKDNLTYAIKYLDITCGLPSNRITSIVQDNLNNIWISYSGGLAQISSNNINVYDASVGFPDYPITKICYYNSSIYAGTFGGGLIKLTNNECTQYSNKSGFATDLILDFAILNNELYAATFGKGLIVITNTSCQKVTSKTLNLESNRIIQSIFSKNESLYLTLNDGYGILTGTDLTIYGAAFGFPKDNYTNINVNNDGDIFLGAETNFLYRIKNNEVLNYSNYKTSNNAINHIYTGTSGKTWICTNGDGLYNIGETSYNKIDINGGLSDKYMLYAYQDNYSNLWIGSQNGGINLISPANFFNSESSRSDIKALCVNSDNELVYESAEGGLDFKSDEKITHKFHPQLTNITGIVFDSINQLYWITSNKGLFKLQNNQLSLIDFIENGNAIGNHLSIKLNSKGELIICDYNRGIFILKNNKFYYFPEWLKNDNTLVFSSFEDNIGQLWVCADKGNLSCFTKDSIINYVVSNLGNPIKFFSATEGDNHQLYFGTNIGLLSLKKGVIQKIIFPFILKNEKIQTLCYSKKNKTLWIGTSNGLVSFKDSVFQYYSENNGMASAAINFNATAIDKYDNIYWSTTKGIVKYFPFRFKNLDIKRTIDVIKLSLNEADIDWIVLKENSEAIFDSLKNNVPVGLVLPSKYKNIEFNFSCKNWGKEASTRFYYRILEQSNDWIYFGNDGILKLQNLSGGNYSLEVKAELADGVNSEISKYKFEIEKPFYAKLWVIILLSLILLTTIWVVIRKYSKFSFDSFESFGNDDIILKKARILAVTASILVIGVDYYHSEISHRYTVNWISNIILFVIGAIIFIYSYYKSAKIIWISNSIKIIFLVMCLLYVERAYSNQFEPILSIEINMLFLFVVFIYKDLKSIMFFIAFILALTAVSIIYSKAHEENKSLFVSAVIQVLINIFLFTLLETKRLSKMLFSDKILNNSEQFIFVLDQNAEIIFTNKYTATTLGVHVKDLLKNGWWDYRGWEAKKLILIKRDMINRIQLNQSNKTSNELFNKSTEQFIYIDWQETPIEGNYMLAIGKDITIETLQKNELEKTLQNATIVNEIGKDISSVFEVELIIEKVYQSINKLMDASMFGIGIYNDIEKNITFKGVIEKGVKLNTYCHQLHETNRLSINCFLNQKQFFTNNYQKDFGDIKTKILQGETPDSLIYLPITKGDKRIGVITVQSFKNNAYNEYQLQLLKNICNYIAIALDNASLYQNLENLVKERTKEIEIAYNNTKLIGKIAQDISSCLTIESINKTVYNNINLLMDANLFGIGVYNPSNDCLEWASFMEDNKEMPFISYSVKDENRIANICFNRKEDVLVKDFKVEFIKYFKTLPAPVRGGVVSSIIYIPLILKEKTIGVVTVQSYAQGVYTEYHLNILKNLAVSIAIAIENANLYQNLEDKVIERTREINNQKQELEKLSIVAEHVSNGIVITSEDNKIEWANNSFLSSMEYTMDELIGMRPIDKFSGPETEPSIKENLLKEDINSGFEILQYTKTDKPIWFLINITPVLDKDNNVKKKIHIVTNITEKKKAQLLEEEKYLKQKHQNNALTQLSIKSFDEFESIDQFYENICEKTAVTLGIDRTSIWFKKTEYIICATIYNNDNKDVDLTSVKLYEKDLPIYFNKIANGYIINAADVSTHPSVVELRESYFEEYNIKSLLDIPIRSNGKLIGIVCCENTKTQKKWDELDENFIKSIADLISINIEAHKRKKAENAIKESEANFRLLNETIDDVFWLYDLKALKIVYISPSCTKVLGSSPEEFYTTNNYWTNYILDEDKPIIIEAHKKIEKEGFYEIEYRIKSDYGIKWIHEKSFGIKNEEGIFTKNSGICSDITYKKKTELALTESENNFRQINETISDVFWLFDITNRKYLYISSNSKDILGIEDEEFYKGSHTSKFNLFEEDKAIFNNAEKELISKDQYEIEYRIILKTGEVRWIKEKSFAIRDINGTLIRNSGICSDITEQKNTDLKIKQLSLVAEKTNNGILIADKDGRAVWANEAYLAMFEIPFEKLVGKFPRNLFNPQEPEFHNKINELTGSNFTLEIECETYLHNKLWVELNNTPIMDDKGLVIQQIEILKDITDRRAKEKTIGQLSIVAENTKNVITISNANDEIEWVNDAFIKLSGYSLEEIKGKNIPSMLRGELTDKKIGDKISEGIAKQESINVEILNYAKDGRAFWVELNINPIFNEKGQLVNYISVGQETTERKQKEILIENQNFDIISSINYAKRIQNALLPSDEFINSLPIDLSIYYKPKDIIGGDFYWADKIEDKIILAIGDCTGHGVPGALMTSLGINGLINSVSEQKITNPAKILTYLDDYIFNILKTTDAGKVNDGMDIGIVCIDLKSETLQFSGASRPMIYVQNKEIIKVDGSRKSIGSKAIDAVFENIEIKLTKDLIFYLFSDGMTDQFGGDKHKRIGSKGLNDLILQISTLNLHKQKQALIDFYLNWDRQKKQTDDMIWSAFKLK